MLPFRSFLQQFDGYSDAAFNLAEARFEQRQLAKGEHFQSYGAVAREIAFVESGLLRLYYLRDGVEVTHCFCREGQLSCAYKSLITRTPSDFSIQALEPSTLHVLSYERLQELYALSPFWQQVGRLASEQEFINTESYARFIDDLDATERYKHILEQDPELLQRVSLQQLSTYLQVAPETLSRIRKRTART